MSALDYLKSVRAQFNASASRITQQGSALADNAGIVLYTSFAVLSAKCSYDVMTAPAAHSEVGYFMPLMSFMGSALLASSWFAANAMRESQETTRATETIQDYAARRSALELLSQRSGGNSVTWAFATMGPLAMLSKSAPSSVATLGGLVAFTTACGLALYGHYRARALAAQFGPTNATALKSNPTPHNPS
jgi:hypothetical protein